MGPDFNGPEPQIEPNVCYDQTSFRIEPTFLFEGKKLDSMGYGHRNLHSLEKNVVINLIASF
jgi:hypothetical protein